MVQKTDSWKKYGDLPDTMQNEAVRYLKSTGYKSGEENKMMFQVKEEKIWAAIYHKTLTDLTLPS